MLALRRTPRLAAAWHAPPGIWTSIISVLGIHYPSNQPQVIRHTPRRAHDLRVAYLSSAASTSVNDCPGHLLKLEDIGAAFNTVITQFRNKALQERNARRRAWLQKALIHLVMGLASEFKRITNKDLDENLPLWLKEPGYSLRIILPALPEDLTVDENVVRSLFHGLLGKMGFKGTILEARGRTFDITFRFDGDQRVYEDPEEFLKAFAPNWQEAVAQTAWEGSIPPSKD